MKRAKVFLLSTGLGRSVRGFESFTAECFDELRDSERVEVFLCRGAGKGGEKTFVCYSLNRYSAPARVLGAMIGRTSYFVEQLTFFLSLIPRLLAYRPEVILFSDGSLGNMLWHFRRLTGLSYKLVLSNGAPFTSGFERWDLVQQVAPVHLERALESGASRKNQLFLPYAFKMDSELVLISREGVAAKRRELALPLDRKIILSPGSLNSFHKRMDYVIREVSRMKEPRPFLLLLGQSHPETEEIRELAEKLLGSSGYSMRSVPADAMGDYFQLSDAVVLASLTEGLARVLVEALSWGKPCFVHDWELTRWVLGDLGFFGDFSVEGALERLLMDFIKTEEESSLCRRRHAEAYTRFSWVALKGRYEEMFLRCLE